ncbi:MAG: MATE family efflux transporter [Clostridia bacterium]|nr:MATE family efflux transporter [Clostridia bacterium]
MSTLTSRKMADMPMGKLIMNMSLPAILSMLVQALYSIVDSLYIARYSTPLLDSLGMSSAPLDALTIAFPMQMLVIAFALGIGVGSNAFISRMLGEKKYDEANKTAQHGLFLALLFGLIFIAVGLLASRPFMELYTSDPIIIQYGTSYLSIVVCISMFSFLEITLAKMLQATGNMRVPMFAQLIGAITNIVLDPILIFGFWIFPEMGIKGAAIATVIGQGAAFTYVLCMFIFKKHDISISFKGFRIRRKYLSAIIRVGLPTTIINSLTSVSLTLVNLIIKQYAYAITVLGVYCRVQSFVFMPVFGLMQGALPIMSYNYGAGNRERFKKAYIITLLISGSILFAGMILFLSVPEYILMLFRLDAEGLALGVRAFRIISLSFVPAAFGITTIIAYQSLGKGFAALIMSLTRQLVFLVPTVALLLYLTGISGIWFSNLIADSLSALIFLPIAYAIFKKEFTKREKVLFNTLPQPVENQ